MKTASPKTGSLNIKTIPKRKGSACKVQVKISKSLISKSVPEYP